LDIIIIGIIAVFFAAFLQACLGFGFGMISVPPLLLVLTASEVVPMQISLSYLLTVPLAWQVRDQFKPRLVVPLLAGAVFGFPLGMKVLEYFDGPHLKVVVGLILVGVALALLSGWARPVKNQTAALVPIGFLSGLMQTTTSMGAPPIILFLTNQNMDKDQFRSNILIYFSFLSTFTCASFAYQGAFTQPVLHRMLIFSVSLIAGGVLGAKLTNKVPQEMFRKVVLVTAAVMGFLLFLRNAISLGG
jgi:hypothetical protein